MDILKDLLRDKLCVIVENEKERDDFCKLAGICLTGNYYPGAIVPTKNSEQGAVMLECSSTPTEENRSRIGGVPKGFIPISLGVFKAWLAG